MESLSAILKYPHVPLGTPVKAEVLIKNEYNGCEFRVLAECHVVGVTLDQTNGSYLYNLGLHALNGELAIVVTAVKEGDLTILKNKENSHV